MTSAPTSSPQAAMPETIRQAGRILAEGGLVAMPTDTVYGLAANALDKYAVARIFEAKGRPPGKPLILLVGSLAMAKKLAQFTPLAEDFAKAYWPGALTIILAKRAGSTLPHNLTAGGDTIAIRIPKDPVALAVIKSAGVPLAVTSANLSGTEAPTSAAGVADIFPGGLDLILDGGPASIGVASTVLNLSGDRPVINRLGAIIKEDLEAFLKSRKTAGT